MAKVKLEKGAVFERYEKKFLLDKRQLQTLMMLMNTQMQMDKYGKHTIATIYYDTSDYAVIRKCLDKPNFREKLRLRSYGIPKQGDNVYLELKRKMAGITYKRRISASLDEANMYMNRRAPLEQNSQISREIGWYLSQHDVSPKVLICYDRIALFGKEDDSLRITFDFDIRWRDYNLSLDKGDFGEKLLAPQICLMEIKTMNALPFWLAHLLSAQKIYPTAFSKYGSIYINHLSKKEAKKYAV